VLSRPLAILVGRLVIGRDELRPNEVVIGGEAPHPDFRTAAHEPDFHHSRSRRGAIHCAQLMVRETSDHARLRRGDRSTSAVSLRLRFGAMPVGYCALRSSLACAAMSARRRRVNTSLRRHTQALLFHGPRVPPNTSFGLGWQAKAVTIPNAFGIGAGFAWVGESEFAATWLSCEGVAEAFPKQRRSNQSRTVRRSAPKAREGGTSGRDEWRWLSVRHILGGRRTVAGCEGGRNDRTRSPSRCKDGVARGASLPRLTLHHLGANPPHA